MTVENGQKLKAVISATLPDGSLAQNAFTFFCSFTSAQDEQDILDALETWFETAYGYVDQDFSQLVDCDGVQVDRIVWDGDKWEVVQNIGQFAMSFISTNASDPLPNQIAPFVSFPSDRPKSRGRKYLYGYTEEATEGNTLDTDQFTRLVQFALACLAIAAIDGENVMVPIIVRAAAETFHPLEAAEPNDNVGTQRRRRPTVGI